MHPTRHAPTHRSRHALCNEAAPGRLMTSAATTADELRQLRKMSLYLRLHFRHMISLRGQTSNKQRDEAHLDHE